MGLKRPLSILIWATVLPAAAQTFSLGSLSDPCVGGTPATITGTTNTLRYGDFKCTLPVKVDQLYSVRLDFMEPCADKGACASGQVTRAGQRVQNVLVQDSLDLSGFDSFTAGMGSVTPISRTVLAYSAAGAVVVRVQTVVRSGVLSGVTLAPITASAGAQITRQQCVGSGTGWNCAGVEAWTTTVGTETRYWTVVPATAETWQIPACPSADASKPCLQPAALNDPPINLVGQNEQVWPDRVSSPIASLQCGVSVYCYKSFFVPATSIWKSDDAPVVSSSADQQGVTLGVKFRVDVAGTIMGIRYFQGSGNTGTHYGVLYAADHTVLAVATFTGETGSGWQQVSFTPVAVSPDATYVAAYFTSTGYAHTEGYFSGTEGVDNVPLHALASGVDGPNGLYSYGPAPQFPGESVGTNYWVDVVFAP